MCHIDALNNGNNLLDGEDNGLGQWQMNLKKQLTTEMVVIILLDGKSSGFLLNR